MPDTPDSKQPETILAFDFGLRRIGVAVGQQVTRSASALGTVANSDEGADWSRIDAYIKEWRPARLIVGQPRMADGKPALAEPIAEFCKKLAAYGLPLAMVDERHSSLAAGEQLTAARRDGRRGRIARGDIDAAAAAVIAERWLAE